MTPTEGTITRVCVDRGYGFIRVLGGPDLFFHVNDLSRDLPFNDQLLERRVQFAVERAAKGLRAFDVRPI